MFHPRSKTLENYTERSLGLKIFSRLIFNIKNLQIPKLRKRSLNSLSPEYKSVLLIKNFSPTPIFKMS